MSIAGCETLLLTIINFIRDTSISTFARKLDAMDEKIERKIAVIFVSDVVGFSTLMKTNEIATLKSLRACVKILENLLEEHGGRIFNTREIRF